MNQPNSILKSAPSRRTFLAGAGSVAAASLVAGCSDSSPMLPPTSSGVSDTDILNFALNLEYLEAEFYLYAATGSGLSATDAGSGAGTTTGGAKIAGLNTANQNILNELAYTEQEHVRFLRTALGSAAVPRPNLNIGTVFNTLAGVAGIPGGMFDPYTNFDTFAVGVFVFEDVGVTAYNGAAPLISPAGIKAGYLAAAAGIMAVEAYHAAFARSYLTANATTQGTTSYPYFTYANQIATLRAELSGGSSSAVGNGDETLLTVPTGATTPTTVVTPTSIVPANSNAIAYARTTDQVLHIVYGTFSNTAGSTTPAAGVAQGGFFPNGMNGNIKVTQS